MMLRLSIFIFFICSLTESRELIQGNLIWRHGDRSSRWTYPNDPYKGVWKDGKMQLTEQGMAQEYDLGTYLRSKYGHLLSEKYREGEIYVKSTDTDRTLMSAQCVMAGLYSPNTTTKWDGITSLWRPFPVHSEGNSKDWLYHILQDPENGCPEFTNLMKMATASSKWYQEAPTQYDSFFKKLTNFTGATEPYTFENCGKMYDNLVCLRSNGYKLPDWAEGEVIKTLIKLGGIHQGLEFSDYEMKYTKKIAKMRSGIILEKMIENMEKRMKGETNFSVVGYSAHDSSVGPILLSMGAFNWIVPPYASCVMLDLYKDDDGSFHVEFHYRNDSTREPYKLSFYECGTECSWKKFREVAATVITDASTPKLCGIKEVHDAHQCSYFLVGLVVFISTVVLFWVGYFVLNRRKRKSSISYNKLPRSETEAMNL